MGMSGAGGVLGEKEKTAESRGLVNTMEMVTGTESFCVCSHGLLRVSFSA